MKHRGVCFAIIILLSCPLLTGAHVPIIVSENGNLESATYIEDPLRSWAVYDELHTGGEIRYYRTYMEKDQVLSLSLFVPEIDTFVPSMAIMGPGIRSEGTPPASLEITDGSGVLIIDGKIPDNAMYEPFTPNSQYNLAKIEINIEEEGTYHVAVYDPESGGRYGLAIGLREEFGLGEWILIPINVIRIHQWEGQSSVLIFAPAFVVILIGYILLGKRTRKPTKLLEHIIYLAGLLYSGSAAIMLTQIFIALTRASFTSSVMITLLFVIFQMLAGLALIRIAQDQTNLPDNMKNRLKMIILGIAGLFIWAGFVVGPVLAILAGLLPIRQNNNVRDH